MGFASRACLFALLTLAIDLPAQEKPWSTEEIHGPKVPFKLTLEEGTWMSVDVSPDGKTIVFDLLGDLFTIPIVGGTATRLTSGPAWDVTPRFSPDGSRVVFLSDRAGPDHVWVIATSGGTAKKVVNDPGNHFGSPIWTPTGNSLSPVAGRKRTAPAFPSWRCFTSTAAAAC